MFAQFGMFLWQWLRARRMAQAAMLAGLLLAALIALLRQAYVAQAAVTPPFTPDFTAVGEVPFSSYGLAVAKAGDINGDGFDDLLVGAPYNARTLYAYTGSSQGLSSTVFFSTTTGQATDWFGYSVDGGGDLDGNGVADFLVSAPAGELISTTPDLGLVYVFTGTAGGQPSLALTLTGEGPGDQFGWSAALAGDVNDDGYADVVVGAWQYGPDDNGRVYVYHGGAGGLSPTPAITLTGESDGDGFGVSVDGAGDTNGDGFDDIVIGAWQYDVNNMGKVYVYFGTSQGITSTDPMTATGAPESEFGAAVAGAGDVNGDGYADVVVGAYRDDATAHDAGRALLFLGSASGPRGPHASLLGEAADDRFGFAVTGAGDINGDGFDDLAAGAYENDQAASNAGKVYAYAGCVGGLVPAAVFSATGEYAGDKLGSAVAGIGDVNGDGLDDLAVGAIGGKKVEGALPIPTGKVFVYYGAPGGCRGQIQVTKQIGLVGFTPTCGSGASVHVPVETALTYCYQVRNTGNMTLTHHFLNDSTLGNLLVRMPGELAPGAVFTHVITHTPATSAGEVVSWTAILSLTAPGGAPTQPPGRVLAASTTATATVRISGPLDDQDQDGIPDNTERAADVDHDNIPNFLDPDSDGDGIADRDEGIGDKDGDGTPNYLDTESDGDNIPDAIETGDDRDGDSTPNYLDDDSDDDGLPDAEEAGPHPVTPVDSDSDSVPDFLDPIGGPAGQSGGTLYLPNVEH